MKNVRKSNKKNKIEEIQKPRGYDRQLLLKNILGCTDCTGELMFIVKWAGCDELDLLPASEINQKNPTFVINFYEQRCPLNEGARERQVLCDQSVKNNISIKRGNTKKTSI